jgi:hypothetical protein
MGTAAGLMSMGKESLRFVQRKLLTQSKNSNNMITDLQSFVHLFVCCILSGYPP